MKPLLLFSAVLFSVNAQLTDADYQRANGLREKLQGLAVNLPGTPTWVNSTRFVYRKTVPGGYAFVMFDAETLQKSPPFDHDAIARALSGASGESYTGLTLPFAEFTFIDNLRAIQFNALGSSWRCELTAANCRKLGLPIFQATGPPDDENPTEFENDVVDGMVSPQEGGRGGRAGSDAQPTSKPSPDGKWEAVIRNYNVFLRGKGAKEAEPLSWDGSEGSSYTFSSIEWSPDSKYLAAYRVRPGYKREVHYVESSPADQLQPKHSTREYAKPGDALDIAQPVVFDVVARKQTMVDNVLFPNPYSLSRLVWRKDSRAFTFEYNQRGHQVYRVIEVAASNGAARAVITEESKTFIDYRSLLPNPRDTGKKFRFDLNDGREMIWASERDGWEQLYLLDDTTHRLKSITTGDWVVRSVQKVDESKRQIWFEASGMNPGEDPYFTHEYRINFDGSGLTPLTEAGANHSVTFSPDMKYFVDEYSRVDLPTVAELRRTEDRKLLMEVERTDITALTAAGWKPPEVFTAKGRDGKTDIWGVIERPMNFDPAKKYPVIENIYAGPQGQFVPKTFTVLVQPLTELGFIVGQMDGMGTNDRSRAFHDVAYRDLGDAGFADRILWHQAVAAKYPYYDLTRVGIFGTSAGGQNSMGALLFHPEFYKVAVSNSGCHDNRMDKIWWNEQWMGWPLGPHYAASSNVDNARRLEGKLLLVVGEMDTNVDPASTLQVVNALIKANKKFDLLFVPGGGHGAGGAYGQRLLEDFFVHNLLGVEPPDWNANRPEAHAPTQANN
jgi:dipeptidyl aminopeptidase/acylaminoacyl peptidase